MKHLPLFFLLLSSCATPRSSQLLTIGAAAGTSAVIGAVTAPTGEKPVAHALMWGGVLGTVGAVVGILLFSEDKKLRQLQIKAANLKLELDRYQSGKPRLTATGSNFFNKPLPRDFQNLLTPGQWKIFEINQWVQDGDNRLIHQDKLVEIIPPTLGVNLTKGE